MATVYKSEWFGRIEGHPYSFGPFETENEAELTVCEIVQESGEELGWETFERASDVVDYRTVFQFKVDGENKWRGNFESEVECMDEAEDHIFQTYGDTSAKCYSVRELDA